MAIAKCFDLASFDTVSGSTEGADVQIRDPLGNPSELHIKVLGPDSPQFRAAQHKGQNAALKRAINKKQSIDFDDLEARRIDVIAECTVGWRVGKKEGENLTLGKEVFECNQEGFRKLYKHFPIMVEQVDAFIVDRANFIKG